MEYWRYVKVYVGQGDTVLQEEAHIMGHVLKFEAYCSGAQSVLLIVSVCLYRRRITSSEFQAQGANAWKYEICCADMGNTTGSPYPSAAV